MNHETKQVYLWIINDAALIAAVRECNNSYVIPDYVLAVQRLATLIEHTTFYTMLRASIDDASARAAAQCRAAGWTFLAVVL